MSSQLADNIHNPFGLGIGFSSAAEPKIGIETKARDLAPAVSSVLPSDRTLVKTVGHALRSWMPRWTSRRYVLLNFLFFSLAVALTVPSILAVTVVSGVHAAAAREALCAKYQKDATHYLRRFAEGGSERELYYAKYADDLKEAATYLSATQPASNEVKLQPGHNAGALGNRFQRSSWTTDNTRIASQVIEFDRQLKDLGAQARLSVSGGRSSLRDRNDLVARINRLSDQLILFEDRSLVKGSQWISGTTIDVLLSSDLVLLLLGFLFSTFFGRMIVRQIGNVSLAVNRIAGGDLSARCMVAGGDDFMRLNQDVNQMASSITQTQTELKHARDRALQASRVKSEFLANMSHEIRTPLNVVVGYTELLADQVGARGDDTMKQNFDAIRRAGQRLNRTIQGILDFSKIEAHSFELRPQSIDLCATLERHVHDLKILADRKGIRLRCVIEEPIATVQFDEYCLSGALTNLLQNAIKFTKEGSITVKLSRGTDRLLRIMVEDTGIGIDLGYLPRIFEPFSQEESGYKRSFEGNGLGLALTRRYLELNGATIQVNSRKGRGSVFTITLSKESELRSVIKKPTESASTNGAIRHANGQRATILVVEDDEDNQSLIRTILEKHYEILMASSADDARRELAGHSVALILMDWSLRGAEDGVTLTRNLRQDERFRSIPVVALTAHALAEDRKLSVATGFDAFLPKPIDRNELFHTLDLLIH